MTANRWLKALLWFHGVRHAQYHTRNTSLPSASSWYLLKCCFRELLHPYPVVKVCFPKGFQRELVGKTRKNCASGTSESSWNWLKLLWERSSQRWYMRFINSKLSLGPTRIVDRLMQSLYSKESILTRVYESGLIYMSYFAFLAIW